MTDINIEMENNIKLLEESIDLPTGYCSRLLSEDDWSFIIKLSALFEAVATEALSAKFGSQNITEPVSYLEYANAKSGKIVFLEKLGVINKDQFNFLKKLAELRNKLVHTISSTKFSFETHIQSLDNNQKKIFASTFGHGLKENFKINEISLTRETCTLENPKIAIWVTAYEILACIHADYSTHTKVEQVKTEFWNALIEKFQ
ncbi:MAG: hypothetical protein ACI4NJ_12400 [Cellvibrio sp.]